MRIKVKVVNQGKIEDKYIYVDDSQAMTPDELANELTRRVNEEMSKYGIKENKVNKPVKKLNFKFKFDTDGIK